MSIHDKPCYICTKILLGENKGNKKCQGFYCCEYSYNGIKCSCAPFYFLNLSVNCYGWINYSDPKKLIKIFDNRYVNQKAIEEDADCKEPNLIFKKQSDDKTIISSVKKIVKGEKKFFESNNKSSDPKDNSKSELKQSPLEKYFGFTLDTPDEDCHAIARSALLKNCEATIARLFKDNYGTLAIEFAYYIFRASYGPENTSTKLIHLLLEENKKKVNTINPKFVEEEQETLASRIIIMMFECGWLNK